MKEGNIQEISLLFEAYEKGMTPNGGGMNKETACYWQAINLCSSEVATARSWYHEEMRLKTKDS